MDVLTFVFYKGGDFVEAQELILDGLKSSFLDSNIKSNIDYKSEFVSNNLKEGKKVISYIEEELQRCDSFKISVAFITMSGIVPLLQTLKELESKGIKGQILTTNYLNFSEPEALKKLASLSNVEIKMYVTDPNGEGFHTKGYIFEGKEIYRFIVGSSNMTQKALAVNHEWNTKIISAPSR